MYAAYHMRDPQVFYNKEDLWTIPTRKAEGREAEMDPYYTIMRLPSLLYVQPLYLAAEWGRLRSSSA